MNGDNVAPIRTKRAGGANYGQRIDALERRMTAVETGIKTTAENTAQILSIIQSTKKASVYVRRYGWRVGTGIIGYAIAAGWINEGMANAARTIFGL